MHYWFDANRPEYVFLAAGTVGGIVANSTRPAEFLYDNLMIHATVVEAAREPTCASCSTSARPASTPDWPISRSARRRCSPGRSSPPTRPTPWPRSPASSCATPTGAQYGCNFVSAMPTNLYGPHDNFDLTSSHVLPALLAKFHDAKVNGDATVEVWGSGSPRREFLHVDDLADACLFLMRHYDAPGPINVGTGRDLTIRGWPR